MKHAEKELQEAIVKDSAKKAITERYRTKSVTMSEAELLWTNEVRVVIFAGVGQRRAVC